MEASRESEEFEADQSPRGRFRRYAGGRISHFKSRQILTLTGAVSLVFLISPFAGILAACIAVTGEVIDCLTLSVLVRKFDTEKRHALASKIATITASFQALTISVCVCIAWFGGPSEISTFFSMAYLSGAALNAGVVFPYHRQSALARLFIYSLTAIIGFGVSVYVHDLTWIAFSYNAMSTIMLAYVVYAFLTHALRGHARNVENAREILRGSDALRTASQERDEKQAELRKLALVAQHANDSVIISDSSGKILWVNETFTHITGFEGHEAFGKRPSELLNGPDSDQVASDEIAESVAAGIGCRKEILNYSKDGSKRWMDVNLFPVRDPEGRTDFVIAIERDITAFKDHARELARAKAAAEKDERAKTEFLATMRHEIRTPMNGIIGLSELLEDYDLPEEPHSYAKTIRSSAEALLQIINDILDFSKLDAGKLSINPDVFSLGDCINDAMNLFTQQAASKGIYLDLTCDDNLPVQVVGDDGRLRQILVNLLGNAIKFTDEGGVRVTATAQQMGDAHQLKIEIKDTGIGIADSALSSIFSHFSQADSATTRRFGGTGLGLTISRLLARRMDGDITVTSILDEGSEFTLTVKLGRVSEENLTATPALVNAVEPLSRKVTVLVAEDNKTNRFLIEKYLKDTLVDLHFAEDGREAIAQNSALKPELIFMDMSMPVVDGIAATKHIRSHSGPQPKIVALTANAFESDRQLCLSAGMNDFLSKPVRKAELLAKIHQYTGTNPL